VDEPYVEFWSVLMHQTISIGVCRPFVVVRRMNSSSQTCFQIRVVSTPWVLWPNLYKNT